MQKVAFVRGQPVSISYKFESGFPRVSPIEKKTKVFCRPLKVFEFWCFNGKRFLPWRIHERHFSLKFHKGNLKIEAISFFVEKLCRNGENGKNVMLNLFQHLINLVSYETLNQVQGEKKQLRPSV